VYHQPRKRNLKVSIEWKLDKIFAMKSFFAAIALFGSGALLSAVSGVKLENPRVTVSEVRYEPGQPRERYIRQSDQIIVFLDDCKYERTDSETHAKEIRTRKSGDVIWHNKGEDAPVLKNLGSSAYRTLVIELK
jgi:hypothetical protein